MEDLSEKINQLLSDPDSMSQILSLAKGLGASMPDQDAPQPSAQPTQMPDEATMRRMMGFLSEANRSGGKDAALFQALKPFVSPERSARMDRAAEIAKLSHIASYALRNLEDNSEL